MAEAAVAVWAVAVWAVEWVAAWVAACNAARVRYLALALLSSKQRHLRVPLSCVEDLHFMMDP